MATSKKNNSVLMDAIRLLFIVLVLCFLLNLLAMSQLKVDTSREGMGGSISNLSLAGNLAKTHVTTEVPLINPTIIPVYASGLEYSVDYGDIHIGNGTAEGFYIKPKTQQRVPAEFDLDNGNSIKALIAGVINMFGGDSKNITVEYKVSIGPIKIPLKN